MAAAMIAIKIRIKVHVLVLHSLILSDEATVTNYHSANRVSDITVLVIELFVFEMFLPAYVNFTTYNAFKQLLTTNV